MKQPQNPKRKVETYLKAWIRRHWQQEIGFFIHDKQLAFDSRHPKLQYWTCQQLGDAMLRSLQVGLAKERSLPAKRCDMKAKYRFL